MNRTIFSWLKIHFFFGCVCVWAQKSIELLFQRNVYIIIVIHRWNRYLLSFISTQYTRTKLRQMKIFWKKNKERRALNILNNARATNANSKFRRVQIKKTKRSFGYKFMRSSKAENFSKHLYTLSRHIDTHTCIPCGFLLVDLSSCVINHSKITDNKWRGEIPRM